MVALTIQRIDATDLKRCIELERLSYRAEEAASPEKLQWRFEKYPALFYAAKIDKMIIGFVCATRCDKVTDETMDKEHNPAGITIAIHSVVIEEKYRRKGIGLRMLRAYIARIRKTIPDFLNFELICKVKYAAFYIKADFTPISMSHIQLGGASWLLCRLLNKARRFSVVDAFTRTPGAGNPAAVVSCNSFDSREWMQKVAAEFNLSETAFVHCNNEENSTYKILYFTPVNEISFCGHATVGTAKVLLDQYPSKLIRFELADSTIITASTVNNDEVLLKFPIQKPLCLGWGALESTLTTVFGFAENETIFVGAFESRAVIEVNTIAFERLFSKQIDMVALKEASHTYLIWVITTRSLEVTKSKYPEGDFYSRAFAPIMGINEDPVTGSAHCSLFPHYVESYNLSESRLVGIQTSKRGGTVLGRYPFDDSSIEIEATATIVSKGEIMI